MHFVYLISNQSDEQKRLTAQEVAIMVRIVVCQQRGILRRLLTFYRSDDCRKN